jgi:hypothetical protein
VKQLYLEKNKVPAVGNEVPEVVYVWGSRAKLEMGEAGVAGFIAEFYDDWEDRDVDRLKLDLARLSGDLEHWCRVWLWIKRSFYIFYIVGLLNFHRILTYLQQENPGKEIGL